MNVKIDPFVTIHPDVEIGEGTWIGSNVVIMDGTRIGKNCKIFPGAVLGSITQDLKFKGEYSEIIIGDHTTVREFVTINRATGEHGKTVIGDHVLLMAYSHIGHDSVIGNHAIIGNLSQIAGHVKIHDHVRLAGNVGVQQFSVIGESAFVTAFSLVIKDVPPYVKVARQPLVYVGVNSIGLRRRDMPLETIANIAEIYRWIYNKGLPVSKAVDHISLEFPPTKERDEILLFIEKSTQGIVRRFDSVSSKNDDGN